jgi:hypothetical protein
MKKAPYSLIEAEKLCKEYRNLAGQPFAKNSDATIEFITVAPYDEENKNRFIICYLLFNDPEIALTSDYKGFTFDVLVMASAKNNTGLLHESLHTWLVKNESLVEG